MLNKINKKITLLAVSGGPDSMFLLNKLKNKNIVA
ncbi:tRNA lysidine(34) synthetase TilS, partial [Sulfolobus sp. A20-N-G8]